MPTPRKHTDPAGDKRRAIRQAASAQRKLEAAEAARNAAVMFAHELGGSLREIADGIGLPHMTVKRIIERTGAAQE
jgi:DNA invertase Pin-like site-specific DNA recombinase